MATYINGIGSVSLQAGSIPFPGKAREYHARMVQCPEPEVNAGLEDKYLRRMSRLIRLGWIASKLCLDDARGPGPDAIITGSGWGSVLDSEKFLLSIYRNKENFLPPTPFIQSTHNAVGAQIAMLLNSYEYNMSFAHRSFAFEHALLDSIMRLSSGDSKNVLCGGVDEITANQFTLYDRLNWWRKEPANTLRMISEPSEGSVAGEGFHFFFLQGEPNDNTYARVRWVDTVITDNVAADSQIMDRLVQDKIDWVFAGFNGDVGADRISRDAIAGLFPEGVNIAVYKHLCGEYLTSSAFAMYAAARALREQRIPQIMKHSTVTKENGVRNILIYNQQRGTHHSFILLSLPD